jgi:hypothetical protein
MVWKASRMAAAALRLLLLVMLLAAGAASPVGAQTCDGQLDGTPCDDGVFCNGPDFCQGAACTVHQGDPCAAGATCQNVCDETADTCAAPAGTPCVGDGNPCTDDVCDGTGGCGVANTAPCDDGLFCTGTDTCGGGTCLHTGNPCAGECADTCDETADSCASAPGTPCTEDGNPCTEDQCDGAGACGHPARPGSCDDGQFCNGADTCVGTTCVHGGDPCTGGACVDACNEATNSCLAAPGTPCTPDGNPCTDDVCDGAGGCGVANTAACSDGAFCNGADSCAGGTCSVHAGNPCAGHPECATACNETSNQCTDAAGACDDANPCTADSCNAGTGLCGHQPVEADTVCDDGDACTADDVCGNGNCGGTPIAGCCAGDTVCDDGVACTEDRCTAQRCVNVPRDDRCAVSTDCAATACVPDDPRAPSSGCVVSTAADDVFCSEDGDPCTADACRIGSCLHLDDGSGTLCPRLDKPFATIHEALDLSGGLRGALAVLATCDAGAGPACGSATTEPTRARLTALLDQVHGQLQAAVMALGGRLAPPGAAQPTLDPLLRARLADGLVAEAPAAIRGFLATLREARGRGLVTRSFARDRRTDGRKLLRSALKVRRQLKRALFRRATFVQ